MKNQPIVLLVLACIHASFAGADVVHLCNGDRITGDVQSIRDGVVSVKTAYAGDLAIAQAEVCSIESDEPWAVQDAAASVQNGPLAEFKVADIAVAALTEAELAPPATEEEAPEEAKERLWTGSIDTGLAVQSGTTDSTNFSLGLNLTRTRPLHVLTLNATGLYGEVDGEINSRRWLGEAKWKIYPRERWYAFGLGALEHDAARKLDFRWTAGAGLGVDAWKGGQGLWSLEGGLNYSQEWWTLYTPAEIDRARENASAARAARLRVFGDELAAAGLSADGLYRLGQDIAALSVEDEIRRERDVAIRLASHLERKFFKTSQLTSDLTFLPEPSDWEDFRILSDLLWTTPINDHLSLRINLKTEFDNAPGQEGVDQWDNLLQTGLRYQF